MTLQVIRHPMITGDPNISIEDILIALRVCSQNCGVEALAKPPTWKEKWLNARMNWNDTLIAKVVIDFKEYIEAYSTQPKIWSKESEEKTVEFRKQKIPEQLLITTLLIRKTTLTEEEVWNMPIGKIAWYATSLAYIEGADIDTITTEDEAKMDTEAKELAEFNKRELAKIKGQQARPK